MSYDKLDPSRVLNAASVSLLDCIFLDGHGDAAFATQTGGCVTELSRVDPATRCLFPVAMITWPYIRGQQPTIFALDLRKHSPGVIPPLRQISPAVHTSQWFHTAITIGKDVYERFAVHEHSGVMHRSRITRKRKRRGLGLLGLARTASPLCSSTEQTCEICLMPDGYLQDDTDNVLAAILLLCGKRDWKDVQSGLTKEQLESCLSVPRLSMNQKWDEPPDAVEECD
jgi:hypothetical protein